MKFNIISFCILIVFLIFMFINMKSVYNKSLVPKTYTIYFLTALDKRIGIFMCEKIYSDSGIIVGKNCFHTECAYPKTNWKEELRINNVIVNKVISDWDINHHKERCK